MKSAAFSEEWLEARLAGLLPEFPDVSLCVALSGGVDSVTLLAALSRLAGSRGPARARSGVADAHTRAGARDRDDARIRADAQRGVSSAARRLSASSLRAIHVHHGLHPNADKWSTHCSKLASTLGVALDVIKVRVPRLRGGSLEAAARDARYAALAAALRPGEVLLTAHHQDDQLETVLLQLLRGAGIAGLAAMPDVAPFGAGGRLVRPLLTRSRLDLEEWARAHDLAWLDDDTNTDERFDRNYLRHAVLPVIRERWPGAGAAVSRTSRHAAEARRLLDTLALADVERASIGTALSVQRLRLLDTDRRRNALRYWISRAGFTVPDTRRLDELAGPLLNARPDANPEVRWNTTVVERHADVLSIRDEAVGGARVTPTAQSRRSPMSSPNTALSTSSLEAPASTAQPPTPARELSASAPELTTSMPQLSTSAPQVSASASQVSASAREQTWRWRESPRFDLRPPFAGTLSIVRDRHGPLDLDALPEVLTVQGRRGGETLRPAPSARTRKLKSLLQEAKVPPAQRELLPLICAEGKLIAVADRWLDASVQATRQTRHRARLRFSFACSS